MKFNTSVNVVCEDYSAGQINMNMSCQGGNTSFDPPFEMAAKMAAKYIDKAAVVFIFMTNGGANYPFNGIQSLKKLQQTYPNKLKYAGI
jgi:hypothetical protein